MEIKPFIEIAASDLHTLDDILDHYLPNIPVWAFGSRVKKTSSPSSDLDLVVFAGTEQDRQVHDLKEALDESSLPFRVDVLVWNQISDAFHENIRKQYVELRGASGKQLKGHH